MDRIRVDLDRRIGTIDRDVFGGFVEHLGRCVYGGIYEPGSPRGGLTACARMCSRPSRRLRYANIRYPGGNYVSAYRWLDGVGPVEDRPGRYDPAWDSIEPNTFGTNEFIGFCRQVGRRAVPRRQLRRWGHARGPRLGGVLQRHPADRVGQAARAARLPELPSVRYWGIGNEVDGPWQVGLQDRRRVRPRLHRVRQGHALGGPRHQARGLSGVALGGRCRRADPAAPRAGRRPHRLPLDPLVRGQPGRRRARLPRDLGADRGAARASWRGSRPRSRSCATQREDPSPSRWTSGTPGTRPRRMRATRTSTGSRRSTTWQTRWSWPCTSMPSSATPGPYVWPTSPSW